MWDISPTNVTQRKYLIQPDIQGGLFNKITNPSAYQLMDTSVQYPPLPAFTDTGTSFAPSCPTAAHEHAAFAERGCGAAGLEVFGPALQAPSPSQAPATAFSG